VQGNLNQMLVIIEQIREQDPVLAGALAALADNFAYGQILKLVEQVK